MRKTISVALIVLIAALALVACNTPAPTTAPTTAPTAAAAVPPTTAPTAVLAKPTTAPVATTAATTAPAATATTAATVAPTATTVPTVIAGGEGCAPTATKITWYVGLGAGGDAPVIPKEKAWVDKYNKSQTDACVTLQVVHNPESYDTLKAMIAAGTVPDIVGPVGKAGRASFQGAWADVKPLATAANYDLSKYDPALLDFTSDEGVLVGIPFALFPSFIYYNKDLFDEAKLPYPPHKIGDKYNGKDWNLQTFQDLAMKLTVDKGGNDATQASFDPKNVTQFGFFEQFTDGRGIAAFFKGGLPYDPKDPTKAVIPADWNASWKWYYDGVWKYHFMPNADYQNSDLLAKGNPFSSGNVAMAWTHTWYTCCFDIKKIHWDIAVVPTINGNITAKLHGDTFAILKQSKNQQVAFKVLSAMVVDPDLYVLYGGMPAQAKDRPAFFKTLNDNAGQTIDWSVAEEMVKHPDLPNHEAWLPNLTKANDLFGKWRTMLDQTPGLNMDTEIAKLQDQLTTIFAAAPK
ncbi:MAG: extracellular solute-binding protein [Anaerolineae bacterium]